ncbi:lymphoid-restricted membrane protein isoform X2 [Austrofundulus limnaeus]|uniref:Lymphoid-restricted membrane protein isoform X2 n=1 Tax=Austrofundulus limnaeus TaxID=52670 RepID=A0A2I4C585_AUSLI|nr:PREDICTED: lymphoid-restricted membrane protein-like isoform X2 [Austrofundulus limnaeus]
MIAEDFHPDAQPSCCSLPTMQADEDSEEETSQEELSVINWSDLSIIERVGLNSVDMSEKDLEAFSQIALAFRCDQYTLKQRLQAEEHARNLAEENIQLELTRGRETLETLRGLCLDSQRSNILQRLQLSLDILGGTVERISNTAEVLGAVHQEARVSRTVELMVAHVESLRRRHDRNVAELEETKRLLQQQQQQQQLTSSRNISPDPEDSEKRKGSNQSTLRRRISASIISSQTQEKKKQDSKKRASTSSKKPSPQCGSPSPSMDSSRSFVSKEDSNSTDNRQLDPVEPPEDLPPDPSPPRNPESPASQQMTPVKTQNKNPPVNAPRQRHKGKAASTVKRKEKTVANIHRQNYAGMCGSTCKQQQPLTLRSHRCRSARVCTNLFMLFCAVTLTYYVWKLYEGELEP